MVSVLQGSEAVLGTHRGPDEGGWSAQPGSLGTGHKTGLGKCLGGGRVRDEKTEQEEIT